MHKDYIKLCEFELKEVDDDIAEVFKEIGPGYHGLPIQIQMVRELKQLNLTLNDLDKRY